MDVSIIGVNRDGIYDMYKKNGIASTGISTLIHNQSSYIHVEEYIEKPLPLLL